MQAYVLTWWNNECFASGSCEGSAVCSAASLRLIKSLGILCGELLSKKSQPRKGMKDGNLHSGNDRAFFAKIN